MAGVFDKSTLDMIQAGGQTVGGIANLAALGNQPAPGARSAAAPGGSPIPEVPLNNFAVQPLKMGNSPGAAPTPLPLVQPKTLAEILAGLSSGR